MTSNQSKVLNRLHKQIKEVNKKQQLPPPGRPHAAELTHLTPLTSGCWNHTRAEKYYHVTPTVYLTGSETN